MTTPGPNPTTPPKKRRWLVVVIVVAIILALLGTWWFLSSSSDSPDKATVAAKLTVTTVNYTCPTDTEGLVPYKIVALNKEVGDPPAERAWSDSVSARMTTTTSAERLGEVQLANCQDPLYGSMLANHFANLEVDGVKILSLNPWLKGFEGSGDTTIHNKAATYVPLLDVPTPTKQQRDKHAEMNRAWQTVASKLNTMLFRFRIVGEKSVTSAFNYHLLGGGLVAGGLPPIGLNTKQEGLPALHLILTAKGSEDCLDIGFNTGDKRLQGFNCSSSTQPPAKPNCKTNCTPPLQTCKTNCAPTTPPGCLSCKIPSQAPGQGGAGDGGAGQYGGTGTDRQKTDGPPAPPAAGNPAVTYNPPQPPVQTERPGGSTPTQQGPVPTPAVTPTDNTGGGGGF